MTKTMPEIEILGPEDAAEKEARVRVAFWPTAKRALRQIPLMTDVVAAYYAMLDPQTPSRSKWILLGAFAYFVAPVDAVPDFILGLGFLDDASVIAAAIAAVSSSIREEHRHAARRALADDSDLAEAART